MRQAVAITRGIAVKASNILDVAPIPSDAPSRAESFLASLSGYPRLHVHSRAQR